jgi:UPF0755 protein
VNRRDSVLDDWSTDPWDDPGRLYDFESERPRHNNRAVKTVVLSLLALGVVAVLVIGAVGFWTIRQINPSGTAAEAVNFTVQAGDNLNTVSDRLQAEGIITSARVFRWYAGRHGKFDPAPGYYTLRPRDTMGNILQRLKTPPAQTYDKVTFPEGFTLEQFAQRLQAKVPRLSADVFMQAAASGTIRSKYEPDGVSNLEGLLFPDTYQVAGNETEQQVLTRLVKAMDSMAARIGIDQAPQKVLLTPYQVLIVASIIEREAKVPEDRPMIARVIYNRLFFKMPLQIDSTLYYGQPPNTSFDTLKATDTPYNTYLHNGLPPAPIASPGRASIMAALNPSPNPDPKACPASQKTPCAWLYYVLSDSAGHHAFATNAADHAKNVAKAKAAGLISG